jgi:hypothetical protein
VPDSICLAIGSIRQMVCNSLYNLGDHCSFSAPLCPGVWQGGLIKAHNKSIQPIAMLRLISTFTIKKFNVCCWDVLVLWLHNVQGGDIMGTAATRATVYLDPELHKALRLKAVETTQSISKLVNDAIKESLAEDAEDIAAFKARAKEPLISYDAMIKRLKKDGRI